MTRKASYQKDNIVRDGFIRVKDRDTIMSEEYNQETLTHLDNSGFRLKGLITLVVALFVIADISSSGAISSLVTILLIAAYLILISSLWYDAEYIQANTEWNPNPWLWSIVSFSLYGLPILLYLSRRSKHIGSTGTPLTVGIPQFIKTAQEQKLIIPPASAEKSDQNVDKWVVWLKGSLLILLVSAFLINTLSSDSSLTAMAGLLMFSSYLAVTGFVYLDSRIVNQEKEWTPNYWLWPLATFICIGFPAILYLNARYRNIGNVGPSLVITLTALASSVDIRRVGTGNNDKIPRAPTKSPSEKQSKSFRDKIIQADDALDRGKQLMNEEKYAKAQDSFKDALSVYQEVSTEATTNVLLSAPRIDDKIEQAEQGIEDCWIIPLTNKVDTAEKDLTLDKPEEATETFKQVQTVLETRTFDHRDTDDLKRRVCAGLDISS